MDHRLLGASGCVVSNLALGTMTFGNETDAAGAHAQLDAFVAAGGTLVDTADVYTNGAAEEIVASWLRERPTDVTEPVVLATKGRFPLTGVPNGQGLSARHLTRALDGSLRRLGVDAVDLYQVHAWDPATPLHETLRTLDGFVRAGKVRYYGLSNFTGWQVAKAAELAQRLGLVGPVTLQTQYSLLVREVEWEVLPATLDAGMGVLPWSPLAGGWLSGKYRRDARPEQGTRMGTADKPLWPYERRAAAERTWDVVDALGEVARGRGVSVAQAALAWVGGRPGVASTVLGARTGEQLADNLAAADLVLDAEEVARLDAASDPAPADYPYGVPASAQRNRPLAGGRDPRHV